MTSAAKTWFESLSARSYTGIVGIVLCLIAASLLGLVPDGGVLIVRAAMSGVVWAMAMGIVLWGGREIDKAVYYGSCFIAAGLTCAIPNLFNHDSPVANFVILAPIGYIIFLGRAIVEAVDRFEREKK